MSSFVQPEKWYFAVDCAKCGEAIPFGEAPSPEDAQEVKYRTIAELRCPGCNHVNTYEPDSMSRRPGPEIS